MSRGLSARESHRAAFQRRIGGMLNDSRDLQFQGQGQICTLTDRLVFGTSAAKWHCIGHEQKP